MDKFADNLQKNVVFNMQQISEGNIDVKPAIIDDKDEIGPALNRMINAIGSMSDEISRCCHAALEGNLLHRADVTPYQGKYQKIVQGFNDTIDAIMGPINDATKVFIKIAHKDLTVRMIGDYKGDYARIKESLNQFMESLDKALQQVAIGADQVASASVPGKHGRAVVVTGSQRTGQFAGGSVQQPAGDVLHDQAEHHQRQGGQGRGRSGPEQRR